MEDRTFILDFLTVVTFSFLCPHTHTSRSQGWADISHHPSFPWLFALFASGKGMIICLHYSSGRSYNTYVTHPLSLISLSSYKCSQLLTFLESLCLCSNYEDLHDNGVKMALIESICGVSQDCKEL